MYIQVIYCVHQLSPSCLNPINPGSPFLNISSQNTPENTTKIFWRCRLSWLSSCCDKICWPKRLKGDRVFSDSCLKYAVHYCWVLESEDLQTAGHMTSPLESWGRKWWMHTSSVLPFPTYSPGPQPVRSQRSKGFEFINSQREQNRLGSNEHVRRTLLSCEFHCNTSSWVLWSVFTWGLLVLFFRVNWPTVAAKTEDKVWGPVVSDSQVLTEHQGIFQHDNQ